MINDKAASAALHLAPALPAVSRRQNGAASSFTIVLFASVLIWVSRPFGLGQLPGALADRLIVELAGICLVCDALLRAALPALWSAGRDDSRWTSGAELVRTLFELLLLATAIVSWTHWRLRTEATALDWLMGAGITILCAGGPVAIRVLLTERRLRQRHQATALAAAD